MQNVMLHNHPVYWNDRLIEQQVQDRMLDLNFTTTYSPLVMLWCLIPFPLNQM